MLMSVLIGSWSGVDGPSQMALEDIGMFRSIPNCVVFYPSDAVSCERAVELAANYKDMTFIRATRGNTPVVYKNDEHFEIGKAKVRTERSSFEGTTFVCGLSVAFKKTILKFKQGLALLSKIKNLK